METGGLIQVTYYSHVRVQRTWDQFCYCVLGSRVSLIHGQARSEEFVKRGGARDTSATQSKLPNED